MDNLEFTLDIEPTTLDITKPYKPSSLRVIIMDTALYGHVPAVAAVAEVLNDDGTVKTPAVAAVAEVPGELMTKIFTETTEVLDYSSEYLRGVTAPDLRIERRWHLYPKAQIDMVFGSFDTVSRLPQLNNQVVDAMIGVFNLKRKV